MGDGESEREGGESPRKTVTEGETERVWGRERESSRGQRYRKTERGKHVGWGDLGHLVRDGKPWSDLNLGPYKLTPIKLNPIGVAPNHVSLYHWTPPPPPPPT